MNDHIDVRGGSGKLYRFRLTNQGRPASAMSGTYAYVRADGKRGEVLFVGDADNLMNDARSRWDEAVSKHKATHLYVRLNISAAVRRGEIDDILEDRRPVMNE
jgi:hypothetical protein